VDYTSASPYLDVAFEYVTNRKWNLL
jgi:hypothetical protein